jgi:hypothetical protein
LVDSNTRPPGGPRRRLVRWRNRVALGAGVTLVTLASVVATGGTPAQAAGTLGCNPAAPGWTWTAATYVAGLGTAYVGDQVVLTEVTPEFLVSQQLVVVNGLSTTITGTFTSSVSHTYTYSVGGSVGGSLFGVLTATVSTTITNSTTTLLGVSASAPVPPGQSVIGQYGVDAYYVTYTENVYVAYTNNFAPPTPSNTTICTLAQSGVTSGSAIAPTVLQGWRLIPG